MTYSDISPWGIAKEFFRKFPRNEAQFDHVFVDVSTKPGGWSGTFNRNKWKSYSVAVDPHYLSEEVLSAAQPNERFAILATPVGTTSDGDEEYMRIDEEEPAAAAGLLRAETLRQLLEDEVRDIDLLKSDCRGLDLPVLSALNFRRFRPRLITVKAHRDANAFGYSDRDLVSMLESCGYKAYMLLQIINDGRKQCIFFGDYHTGDEYRAKKQDEYYIFVESGMSRYFERELVPERVAEPADGA